MAERVNGHRPPAQNIFGGEMIIWRAYIKRPRPVVPPGVFTPPDTLKETAGENAEKPK